MFGRFFSADNPLFVPFGKLVDVVCLSLLWVVCSLPILTLGGATAALYDSVSRCLRGGQNGPYARFFQTLKENLKTGVPAGLLIGAAALGLYRLHGFLYPLAVGRGLWYGVYFFFWVLALVFIGAMGYVLPALSRFELGLGQLLGNCLRLAMGHLPSTLALGLLLTVSFILFYDFPLLCIFFLPCAAALLASLPLERIFKPFMGES